MYVYKWTRVVKRGDPYYECSSKGDKRFSALYAMVDGVSIEEIYQLDIKGYRGKVKHWKEAKGKDPLNVSYEEAYSKYLDLWSRYLKENDLLWEIAILAIGKTITDMFGVHEVNQARAICEILNNRDKYG